MSSTTLRPDPRIPRVKSRKSNQPIEIHAPIAVVAALAAIGEKASPAHGITAGERFVGIVDDRRDPYGTEAHVANVACVVEQAFEVAAEIADVVRLAIRSLDRSIEAVIGAALIAIVIRRIAVDEPIGDDEIHRLARKWFERSIERFLLDGLDRRVSAAGNQYCGDQAEAR
jgi:hypothetical protein